MGHPTLLSTSTTLRFRISRVIRLRNMFRKRFLNGKLNGTTRSRNANVLFQGTATRRMRRNLLTSTPSLYLITRVRDIATSIRLESNIETKAIVRRRTLTKSNEFKVLHIKRSHSKTTRIKSATVPNGKLNNSIKANIKNDIRRLNANIRVLANAYGNSTNRFRPNALTHRSTRKVRTKNIKAGKAKRPFSNTTLFRPNALNIRIMRILQPILGNKMTRPNILTSMSLRATYIRINGIMLKNETTLGRIRMDALIRGSRNILGLANAKNIRARMELRQSLRVRPNKRVRGKTTTPRDAVRNYGLIINKKRRPRGVFTRRLNVKTNGNALRVNMRRTLYNCLNLSVIMCRLKIMLHTRTNRQDALNLKSTRALGNILSILKRVTPLTPRLNIKTSMNSSIIRVRPNGKEPPILRQRFIMNLRYFRTRGTRPLKIILFLKSFFRSLTNRTKTRHGNDVTTIPSVMGTTIGLDGVNLFKFGDSRSTLSSFAT